MINSTKKPQVLVILDGFGYSAHHEFNAIFHAKKPFFEKALLTYPHTLLHASGSAVGLFEGQSGNSEVGHLTIGSGRVITQDIVRISNDIQDGSFFHNDILIRSFATVRTRKKSLHLMGLVSDGGVHSHEDHLIALLRMAHQCGLSSVFVHAFLDGRDTPPQSAKKYLEKLDEALTLYGGTLASVQGRFYAMDRDQNWQRTQQAYTVLTHEQPSPFHTWQEVLNHYYEQSITDEFIPPTQLNATGIIHDGDGVLFFNLRPDRARHITAAFVEKPFCHFPTQPLSLSWFITMTEYDKKFSAIILYKPTHIAKTLKEILNQERKTMFSIAETEKYAHVTYFFNGGKETALSQETRVLIPSIPTKNYALYPHMCAQQITDAVIHSLKTNPCDFYLINYANADMVGHSGDFNATVVAIECLDNQLQQLFDVVVAQLDGTLYITGDHGNAEAMFDTTTHQPHTAHTSNPVYFIMIQKGLSAQNALPLKSLSDIAPWILQAMNLNVPAEMHHND